MISLLTDVLSAALRSVSTEPEHTCANEVVMKLAKKNNVPVLSSEILVTTHMCFHVK
jgi:hypothetical protein